MNAVRNAATVRVTVVVGSADMRRAGVQGVTGGARHECENTFIG